MPIYEYTCPKCKRLQEVMQKLGDPAPVCACVEGDPVEMQKQLSLGSFQLKGHGWERDGYANKRGKNK